MCAHHGHLVSKTPNYFREGEMPVPSNDRITGRKVGKTRNRFRSVPQ
ncbi:hypothetical protein A33Q_2701 [Indibacter alkaliphilus LW1]|uniref:Uncharacterized protein n=1 Tax=Indibacter alkaliphilus (strain CCUG 57479 / KCTC 22604 / LW1) TaxID=1189612 RepID=S2E212_INDAL|nr:hypothetical protein A33Q_2701 [Indibacter alkaliphilus LW1]